MKITPLEIKQQQFEKSLRGYDVADVQAFLTLVSNEYEHLLTKNKELEEQIEKLSERVKHYERVEEALHETLQTTKESVGQKMDNARLEAKNLVDKARLEAESVIKEANYEKTNIRQSILRLLDKRDEIIAGISSYLQNTSAAVQKFKDDDMKMFALANEPEETNSKIEEDAEAASSKFTLDEDATADSFLNDDADSSFPPGSDRLDDILDEID